MHPCRDKEAHLISGSAMPVALVHQVTSTCYAGRQTMPPHLIQESQGVCTEARGKQFGLGALVCNSHHTIGGMRKQHGETAETSTSALNKAFESVHFSAIDREQNRESPIGTPRISKLGRWEKRVTNSAEQFAFRNIDVKPQVWTKLLY